MTKFVIRSMSTTDYDPRSGSKPEPYHLYLARSECRGGAYWRSRFSSEIMTFESIEDALCHGENHLNKLDDWSIRHGNDRFDVVPFVDKDVPTYWDARAGKNEDGTHRYRNRVIGTEIIERKV